MLRRIFGGARQKPFRDGNRNRLACPCPGSVSETAGPQLWTTLPHLQISRPLSAIIHQVIHLMYDGRFCSETHGAVVNGVSVESCSKDHDLKLVVAVDQPRLHSFRVKHL